MVKSSAKMGPNEAIWAYEPYRLQSGYDKKAVCFTLEFFIGSVRYIYTIHFTRRSIVLEKLIYYPLGREVLIFDREEGSEIIFGESFRGEKKTIEKLTLPNQLFLSKAAENNSESCIPVFNFITNGISILLSLDNSTTNVIEQSVAEMLSNNPSAYFAKKLVALICSLDTGIRSLAATETGALESLLTATPSASTLKSAGESKFRIKTVHDVYDQTNEINTTVLFDLADESAGTRSLISIAGIILAALETGKVVIIDEFEKNLHPLITAYLVKLFTNPLTNSNKAQLLFATHDITQLQDENFNRDQVWFTQKNERGETELIRCSDIKGLRLNAPLDKWYISGRLGGTAIINDTDFIIAMQEGNEG